LERTGEAESAFNKRVKPSVFITLSKNFYGNLAHAAAAREDITLEDVLYLITLFETDLNALHSPSNASANSRFWSRIMLSSPLLCPKILMLPYQTILRSMTVYFW